MPWRLLTGPTTKEATRKLNKQTVRRSKFLVDESLGIGVSQILQ
jgi:hypothetical protein